MDTVTQPLYYCPWCPELVPHRPEDHPDGRDIVEVSDGVRTCVDCGFDEETCWRSRRGSREWRCPLCLTVAALRILAREEQLGPG